MTTAFVLRNISAVNFYLYAQDFPIADLGNTVFIGENGCGKSVLLDAIQIVMTGMNKRFLNLNSRVSEGGKSTRTVSEACLGLLDDGEGYERDACLTYIALGFEASDGSGQCTAGVCIEAKASASEETVLGLFVVEDCILRFEDFVHVSGDSFEEKGWQSFLDEQRRKERQIHTFPRQNNRGFLRHLYSIINANERGTQLDPDRARTALRQALSFDIDQIRSVTDFVKIFLLDESPIEIETFQQRHATWRELQKEILRVDAEIKTVKSISSKCERVMQNQFNTHYWTYGYYRAEYDRIASVVAKQRQDIAEMQSTLAGTEAHKQTLADNIEIIRLNLEAVKGQIDGIPAYEQVRRAESEKQKQEAHRRNQSIDAEKIFHALSALREAVFSPSFPSNSFPELVSFVQSQLSQGSVGSYHGAWPEFPEKIAKIISAVPDLAATQQHIEKLYRDAVSQKNRLTQDFEEIERNLNNLRAGGTFMSRDTQEFLKDMDTIGVSAQSLSETADISPSFSEWRGIIEAILGDWCDALIIEPAIMDLAYAHFDQHYKNSRVKLIQSENTSLLDKTPRTGTLAEAVITDNSHARVFLNARLGRIVRANSADDIRKGDLAASTDGKYAHGRGIEYRRLPQIPRLGLTVRNQQIEQLSQQRVTIKQQLQLAEDKEIRVLGLVEAIKQANTSLVKGRDEGQQLFQKIVDTNAEIERQAVLIARLEDALPKGLLEEKRILEADLTMHKEAQEEEADNALKLEKAISHRQGALQSNLEIQQKAAEQLRAAIPNFEQRLARHDPAIAFERFMQRARNSYIEACASEPSPVQLRGHFEALLKETRQNQRAATSSLITSIQEYVHANPEQHPGFEWTKAIDSERTPVLYDWINLRHRHLVENELSKFKVQVDKAVKALVETMVHDFLSRLRANIDAVDRVKDDLNRSLRGSVFMEEVYQIRQERDQDKDTVRYLIDRLDIVAPKTTALMQSNVDPNDPDQVKINELINMLTVEGGDDTSHRRRLQELADYRNYFRFSIDICDPKDSYRKISDLEQRRGKASGGQKFVPLYICLGVAAAAAYRNHLGGSKEGPPQSALILMDEAFEKLDPKNIHKIILFYRSLGLQLIMAAPKTHQALYKETFNTLISIVKVGRAVRATAQHFHPPAHELLRSENPMHKPRSYFAALLQGESEGATK